MSSRKRGRPCNPHNPDRHTSGFMVRLPEDVREKLKKWQDKYESDTRIRPSMSAGVVIAIEDFLKNQGV